MQVVDGDARSAARSIGPEKLDVFLSLWEIPGDVRASLTARKIMWIDLAKKEQSRTSNDLGEEVLNFFKRYGVRTLRYPQTQTQAPLAQPCQVDS
jgi:hypothetical protein